MNKTITLCFCLLLLLLSFNTNALSANFYTPFEEEAAIPLLLQVPPANDVCSAAISLDPLTAQEYGIYFNTGATSDASESLPDCFADGALNNTVWFTFTGDGNAYNMTVTDCNSSSFVLSDSQMAIFEGTDCNSLTELDCSEDYNATDFYSQITLPTTDGTSYYLMVDGYEGDTGDFCIDASMIFTGSNCETAEVINTNPFFFDSGITSTCGSGDDYNSTDVNCNSANFYMNGDDFVYSFTLDTDGCYSFDLENTDDWMGMFILNGCPDASNTNCIANTNNAGNPDSIVLDLAEGTYYIVISRNPDGVSPPSGQCGNYQLLIQECSIFTCAPESDGTIFVTTTEDNGNNDFPTVGSLRAAIKCANETTGANNIHFNLTGTAPFIFNLPQVLPQLTDNATIIDATTQTDFELGDIIIDGTDAIIGGEDGFDIQQADGIEFYGLVIQNFPDDAIRMSGASNVIIHNNILINNGLNSTHGNGIYIEGGSEFVTIQNNYIGYDPINDIAAGNSREGIQIQNSGNVTIGSSIDYSFGNVIAGNGEEGIWIHNSSIGIEIMHNYIGTNAESDNGLGNGNSGILIQNSNFIPLYSNIIAYNQGYGLEVNSTSNEVTFSSGSIFCNTDGGIFMETGGSLNESPPSITTASPSIIEGTAQPNENIEIYIHNHETCTENTTCQGKTSFANTTADASTGEWSIDLSSANLTEGIQISALATNSSNNTSEFSTCTTITTSTCSPDDNGNIYVTTLSDNGDNDNPPVGSLRAAIICANETSGPNHIYLDTNSIPTDGPYLIQPLTELPSLTDAQTYIDFAYTDNTSTGYVELDGSLLDSSVDTQAKGLTLQGDSSEICGFYIHSFPDDGVFIDGCDGCKIGSPGKGNIIAGNGTVNSPFGEQIYVFNADNINIIDNLIGTNLIGDDFSDYPSGEASEGVFVENSSNVVIGGDDADWGNTISGNTGNGVWLEGSENVVLKNNFIGTNAEGTAAIGNTVHGIRISDTFNPTIGGEGMGNVISGNEQSGLYLEGAANTSVIINNKIGTDLDGTFAIANGDRGIYMENVHDIFIEGDNLISGNSHDGIWVGDASFNVQVTGNKVGTDATGTASILNGCNGISISAANEVLIGDLDERNLISGNNQTGIWIGDASDNITVFFNYIGTDISGTFALPNGEEGIEIDSSNNVAIDTNIISGNNSDGILIHNNSEFPLIFGNTIGANAGGSEALSNNSHGVNITQSYRVEMTKNLISGNGWDGIHIGNGANLTFVYENKIGTDITGTFIIGNGLEDSDSEGDGIAIKGAYQIAIADNLISGNRDGIDLSFMATEVELVDNKIGIDITEENTLGNTESGIKIDSSAITLVRGNIIGGNGETGILVENASNNTTIKSNFIGVSEDGTMDLANGTLGIEIWNSINTKITNNQNQTDGNTIANHTIGIGVYGSSDSTTIHLNSIYCNTHTGIDIGTDNPTPNLPFITKATPIQITGTADTNTTIELFLHNDTACNGVPCQGKTFIGTTTTDNEGNWTINSSNFIQPLTVGQNITATATFNGNTSEFTECLQVCPTIEPIITGETAFCEWNFTTLTVNDFSDFVAEYFWSTGENSQAIEVSESGIYTVTVSDGGICSGTTSIEVMQNTNPIVTIFSPNGTQFCLGSSLTLFVDVLSTSNIVAYEWSTGESGQNIAVSEGGIFTLTVTDNNNCSASTSIFIEEYESPTLLIDGDLEFCSGESTLLSTNETYISYLWSNGLQTPSIEVTAQGFYSLIVTDENGCSAEKDVFVVENNLPSVLIEGENMLCDPSILLNAFTSQGSGEYFYKWSTGDTEKEIIVTETGTYSVTVNDSKGCSSMDEHLVEACIEDCDVIPYFVLQDTICTSVFLTFSELLTDSTTTGGIWEITYPDGTIVQPTDDVLTFPQIGIYTLVYFVSSSICNDSHTEIIYAGFPDEPFWSLEGGNNDICETNIPIAVFPDNEGGYWCCEGFENCNATDESCFTIIDDQMYFAPTSNSNAIESYELSYVTTFENCSSHSTKTVNIYAQPSAPEVSTSTTTFCLGEITDAFINITAPSQFPNQLFTFNIYDESGNLLIEGVKFNEDVVDVTGLLTSIGTHTFWVKTINGACESEAVDVSFLVESCSSEFTAIDDNYTTCTNTPITFTPLENDLGECLEIIGLMVSGENITLEQIGNEITYTPATDFLGTIDFEYILTDCLGQIDTALVTIEVLETTLIEAVNDTVYIWVLANPLIDNTSYVVSFNILENDKGDGIRLIDIDYDDTFLGESMTFSENGTVVFHPTEGEAGMSLINYTIEGNGCQNSTVTSTGTIHLHIHPHLEFLDEANKANQMVETILGMCVPYENVTLTGTSMSYSQVTDSHLSDAESHGLADMNNLPFTDGIILSTGNALDGMLSPNTTGSLGTNNGLDGDADLMTDETETFDATSLEFDFTAISESISFRYWFGSEEYPEWIESQFKDRMAIFISGGQFTDPLNIATLADGTAVGVETVNQNTNSDFFQWNEYGALPQYDGFTTALEAIATGLTLGETYHIKIVIADVGDAEYDSGIFIEANMDFNDLEFVVSDDATINLGDTFKLSAEVLNTTANVTYEWTPTQTLDNPNIANPTASPTETTTYKVSATIGDCSWTSFVTITVIDNPVPCTSDNGIIYVTTTEDNGDDNNPIVGSLRAAILCANADPDLDLIHFNITNQAAPYIIQPTQTTLPALEDEGIVIDATTQLDWEMGKVELDGSRLIEEGEIGLTNIRGFQIYVEQCAIYGFYLHDFTNHGIVSYSPFTQIGAANKGNVFNRIEFPITMDGAAFSKIQGNYIGTNPLGTAFTGEGSNGGIGINNSELVWIGGETEAEGNVISGNTSILSLNSSPNSFVQNNRIGTDITGSFVIGNQGHLLIASDSVSIVNNLISGNETSTATVWIQNATGGIIEGNKFGTDITGNMLFGNLARGITIENSSNISIGSPSSDFRQVFAGNGTAILLKTCDNITLQGNAIGTDIAGIQDFGNDTHGLVIDNSTNILVGGSMEGEGNLISANGSNGVVITDNSSEVYIEGNKIGTDITGKENFGNGREGILIDNAQNIYIGSSEGGRNLISGNLEGIRIANKSQNIFMVNNKVGTDIDGEFAIPNQEDGIDIDTTTFNLFVGDAETEIGNLISGNGQDGIDLHGAIDVYIGFNIIGLTQSQNEILPNEESGIDLELSENITIEQNTLAGNTAHGLLVQGGATSLKCSNNFIGTNSLQETGLGNQKEGILVLYTAPNTANENNEITNNTIAYNAFSAIQINFAQHFLISENSIFCNEGGGILLRDGANNNHSSPIITNVAINQIEGTAMASDVIEVFAEDVSCADCQGKIYLGTTIANDLGDWELNAPFDSNLVLTNGMNITATAITNEHHTSEFADCKAVVNVPCEGLSAGVLSFIEPYVCFGNTIGGEIPIEASDFTLREGDVLGYVLQDGSGNVLAYRTDNANFGFADIEGPGGAYNTEYFVMAIAGLGNGSGEVDLTGECIDRSNSFAVVFLEEIILNTNVLCQDNEQFQIEVSLSGGLPDYIDDATYQLTEYEGDIFTGQTVIVGPFDSQEIIELEATDGNGCFSSVEIQNYSLAIFVGVLDITNDTIIISEGESVQLVAQVLGSNVVNYNWTPTEDLSFPQIPSVTATPDTSRTYTVEVLINNNCSLTANITILVLPTANDCVDAILPCDNEPIQYNSGGEGIEEIAGKPEQGCLANGGEHYSTWVRLQIDNSTPDNEALTFTISPNDGQKDYDFVLYKSADCSSLGAPIRCSFADSDQTGLNLEDTDTEDQDNGFASYVEVNGGEVYYLMIDNFSGNFQGFTLEWTNPNVAFNCEPTPECLAEGGELSLNKQNYCDESNIVATLIGENTDFLTTYLFLTEDSIIVSNPEIGVYCLVALNYPPDVVVDDYTTIEEIEEAVAAGVCMDLSNIVCFEVLEVPPPPTFDSKHCDHEILHGDVIALADADIRWYAADTLFTIGNNVHLETAGIYHVTQTLNDCESEVLEIEVTEADLVCLGDCPDNLVQNFSFEEYDNCPEFAGDIREADFWRSPIGTAERADYFNDCNPTTNNYGTPQNIVGTQTAFEGVSYAGLKAYNQANNDLISREYIQTQLNSTLIEGQSYCVSMQVSLAENSQFAIDNLGIYFSENQIMGSDIEDILEPQIEHQGFLEDTENWMEVKGTFTATSGLQYLAIGNFALNSGVKEVNSTGNGEAYYYIDFIDIRPTNEIESLLAFDENGEQLNTESNTIVICPDETIRLEATTTTTNFSCDLGWIEALTDTIHQMSYTIQPTQDTTVYHFWVSNGLCEVADSLVVILGDVGSDGDCALSVCPQIQELTSLLQNLELSIPYQMNEIEVDLTQEVGGQLLQLAQTIEGFDEGLLAGFEVNMVAGSLQTEMNPAYLEFHPNRIVYNNSDPSNYAYIGQDQLTYTLTFPSCGTVTRSLTIDFLCPDFEVNEPSSDCQTAFFRLTNPTMFVFPNNTINLIEASNLGWSYQYKIEGENSDWMAASEETFLETNDNYTVLLRIVKANSNPIEPIFQGSYAETCGVSIATPSLEGMTVGIVERCLEDGSVELTIATEGLDEPENFVFEWSTGETTQQIVVSPPFDESYWVEALRINDGCRGIDSVFHIGPPDVFIEYTDKSRCVATIGIRNSIPQSITCYNEQIPEEDCWWNQAEQAYKCEINLWETTSEMAYVVVNDFKGCTDSVALFTCLPDIHVVKPNPSKRLFTIELTGIPIQTPIRYYVYDISGRMVMSSDNLQGSGKQPLENWRTVNIDLDERFVSGMYFVQFSVEDWAEPLRTKLVKGE